MTGLENRKSRGIRIYVLIVPLVALLLIVALEIARPRQPDLAIAATKSYSNQTHSRNLEQFPGQNSDTRPVALRFLYPTRLTTTEKGRQVYVKFYCGVCHGLSGEGKVKNPNAQTGSEVPGLIYVAEGYTRDELRAKIENGVAHIEKADTAGAAPPLAMPAWKDKIKSAELEALLDYLISLMPKEAEEKW